MTVDDYRARREMTQTPYDRLLAELRETRRDRDWWRRATWTTAGLFMFAAMLGWVR